MSEPKIAKLSTDEMRRGIARIQARITELRAFDVSSVTTRWSGEIKALQTAIEETLSKVFGHGTVEYNRYDSAAHLDNGPLIMGRASPPAEVQKYLTEGIAKSLQLLQQAIRGLEEDLQYQISGAEEKPADTTLPFDTRYGIHPAIAGKCTTLLTAGQYPEAVEKSFKVVRDRLRTLTGYETGSDAFGKGRLWVDGAAAKHVEDDFNQGVKFLMMAIDMFRNEKSHTSDGNIDDPVRAHHYLSLSSLALLFLDRASVRRLT